VLVTDDYDGPGGTIGAIYKYVGNNRTNVDLSQEEYDPDLEETSDWERVSIDLRT